MTTNNTMTTPGVYQLDSGFWAYRYTVTINGKKKDVKKTKDDLGKPFKTDKAAFRARETAIVRERECRTRKTQIPRMTVQEVYQEYCEHGRNDKAYQTIRKQESLWNNHIAARFGKRFIDEISVAEVNDYLTELYYTEGRAYRYVESFLKMFYLIFGQAYSRNFLDVDTYNKLCVNKDTRIHMPKMKIDEDTDIVTYSREQVEILDNYFQGSNAETAYLLGRYCGLRINECYGLKWENVDIKRGTITIDRQMQYQDGLIKLVSLKTRNARRTVYMSDKLKSYFLYLERENKAHAAAMAAQRAQNQTFIMDIDGKQISSLELVNSLPNGKIQTVNSMKYHSRTIKSELGIDFKFHHLRHTCAALLAANGARIEDIKDWLGHSDIKITAEFYMHLEFRAKMSSAQSLEQLYNPPAEASTMTAMEEEIYMLRRQVKILREELGNTVFQQEALPSEELYLPSGK